MTTRSSSSSSSNLFNALVLISIIVAGVFLLSSQSQLRTPRQAKVILPQQQQQQQSLSFTKNNAQKVLTMNNKRNMVGGYSTIDSNFLSSDEIMEIANFVLKEHANKSQSLDLLTEKITSTSSSLAVVPEEVANGTVKVKVLEAQRQVSFYLFFHAYIFNEISLNSSTDICSHLVCGLST